MANLLVAAVFLIGTHFGIASTPLRQELVARVGQRVYLVLYSALALVAIGWLIAAWRAAPLVPIWNAGAGLRHLLLVIMPVAFLLLVGALSSPNPTAVGQRPDPDAAAPAHGILRITRHPFLWGVALWAVGHLFANGDQASTIFFGAFAVLALAGTGLIDARRTRENAPGWGVFLQATSNVPFQAILQRRQKLVWSEIGLARVTVALALYVLLLWLHPRLFGVSPLG